MNVFGLIKSRIERQTRDAYMTPRHFGMTVSFPHMTIETKGLFAFSTPDTFPDCPGK
jgi:hypothetical protein